MDPSTGGSLDFIVRCDPNHMCLACLETETVIQWIFAREMANPLPCNATGSK
jgi:hypothetical protein